jgi:hypothetical protein
METGMTLVKQEVASLAQLAERQSHMNYCVISEGRQFEPAVEHFLFHRFTSSVGRASVS